MRGGKKRNQVVTKRRILRLVLQALHAGFCECDQEIVSRHKASGTTATLAVQVGSSACV